MNNKTIINKLLIKDLRERWAEIGHYKTTRNLKIEIEFYKKMLKFFQVGPSYFMIFNPPEAKIEYVSSEIEQVLGYNPGKFDLKTFLNGIHPEDVPYFVEFEDKVVDFKMKLPPEKLMKYKSRYDYRLRKASGEYTRVLQQSVTIQTDESGAVLRNLVVYTDISDLKKDSKMTLSFIGLYDEPSFLNVETEGKYIPSKDNFTEREKEIINLISQNKTSEKIAEELNISIHTVKTHRKNINKKSGTSNALELVTKALKNGWI